MYIGVVAEARSDVLVGYPLQWLSPDLSASLFILATHHRPSLYKDKYKFMIRAKTPLQITSFDLSNKGLTEIPNEVFDCRNLKKLFLSNNKLTQIPKKN